MMRQSRNPLPIDEVMDLLLESLNQKSNAVLVADPGAGKTTRVPVAMLSAEWLQGQRIVMLEPRRLAARAAARFMAEQLGEQVGETVGYRIKNDVKVGPRTRIEIITEGILTRMLQSDPELTGVGALIFDEFHERSIHGDLGLALSLQAQSVFRPGLRILVMSATLDADALCDLMEGAALVRSSGRAYPVETIYESKPVGHDLVGAATRAVQAAIAGQEGDVLVFLPGAGEIRRVAAMLSNGGLPSQVRIEQLYGQLSKEEQDHALKPCAAGERKVVLATSIAETSLTVEGVKVVVDCGWSRLPQFSPRSGMTALNTVRVSRASSEQRRGRAGRLGPGVCYRLWTVEEDRMLVEYNKPEILEADLAPVVLELSAWGAASPAELAWLDEPPAAAYSQAQALLQQLGALDERAVITPHGREMAALGVHPRLAHMLLRARPLGLGGLACELAALLSERDIFRSADRSGPPDVDIRWRLQALRSGGAIGTLEDGGLISDDSALRRLRDESGRLARMVGASAVGSDEPDASAAGLLLAFAYPDRIGERKGGGRFLLASGRGAVLPSASALAAATYLVAAELDAAGVDSRIYLAAPVELAQLEAHLAERIVEREQVVWDREADAVRAKRVRLLGSLTLSERPVREPDPARMAGALAEAVAQAGLHVLPWSKAARQLQQRICFMHALDAAWPDASDTALLSAVSEWLAPHLHGLRSFQALSKVPLADVLLGLLSWEQRRELDILAPTHCSVPSGSRIAIDYCDPNQPVLAVRLQEVFGLIDTPRIGGGRVPLTLHLLSPAMRPVQVTRDLSSFWRNTYFEVRKDLRGRYPKHYWPEDPHQAEPTRRVRPQ